MEISVLVRVCDTCQDPERRVTTYTVIAGDMEGTTDLCAEHEHAVDLAAVVRPVTVTRELRAEPKPSKAVPKERPAPAAKKAAAPAAPRRRGPRPRVLSLDEV